MVDLCLKLPEHYLEEEVRDGYTVSSEMKKIWAVELDLLNEFMRVCKKHDIKFFAAGGTLLGAVRHKGFIPWDDDVDLMMFRSEYNRLCEIGPQEFQHPYFFQTEETDPGSYRGHAQLRNSETTGILRNGFDSKKHINQGIFIDIFPIDRVPDNLLDRQKFYNELNLLRKKCFGYQEKALGTYKKTSFLKQWYNNGWSLIPGLAIKKSKEYFNIFERESTKYNNSPNKFIAMTPLFLERWTWEVTDLSESIDIPFEFYKIPIPSQYDKVLKKMYGDWRKKVIGSSIHGEILFDVDRPYTDYL